MTHYVYVNRELFWFFCACELPALTTRSGSVRRSGVPYFMDGIAASDACQEHVVFLLYGYTNKRLVLISFPRFCSFFRFECIHVVRLQTNCKASTCILVLLLGFGLSLS